MWGKFFRCKIGGTLLFFGSKVEIPTGTEIKKLEKQNAVAIFDTSY
jgi:hypothetical protein